MRITQVSFYSKTSNETHKSRLARWSRVREVPGSTPYFAYLYIYAVTVSNYCFDIFRFFLSLPLFSSCFQDLKQNLFELSTVPLTCLHFNK